MPSGRPARHLYFSAAVLSVASLACTNAGLYSSQAAGPGLPDRAVFQGNVCIPPETGTAFPVKVLFAVEGGAEVPVDVKAAVNDAMNALTTRFTVPYVEFALMAFHTVPQGLQGSFVAVADPSSAWQNALIQLQGWNQSGPVSLRSPLLLAQTILSGDMQTTCQGTVERTRYLVVLIFASQDTTCNNPFDINLNQTCTNYLSQAPPDIFSCDLCELTRQSIAVQALAQQFHAGEVSVQPIYVQTGNTIDPVIQQEAQAIATAGGTNVLVASAASLSQTLTSLNYSSFQKGLTLKRLIAFNRNATARSGQLLVDSDGDGIPDVDEVAMGTNPLDPDSSHDGLMDGVKLRMGLSLQVPNILTGCNSALDADGDRLNDCEEQVLGTNPCEGDTDADGIPDLVEVLSNTNPLIPEDLQDADRDGVINIDEVTGHSDVLSQDLAFRAEHGYAYQVNDSQATPDGRACYDLRISNVGLVDTQLRPNKPFSDIPRGTNDIYLYFVAGRPNDPRGSGVSALNVQELQYITPKLPGGPARVPAGVIPLASGDFVLGL